MFFDMECCQDEQTKNHKKIEKMIRNLNKQFKKEIKLLLLGTGESGKSTFIRQMRIIYNNGYTDEERKSHIKLIHENIFSSMQCLVRAMETLKIKYEKEENATKNASLFAFETPAYNITLNDSHCLAINELWHDLGIQECYRRRREYQLNDSTFYYISRIDTIIQEDYIPNDQDILRVRVATTGIIEHKFEVNNANFHITDVGGQRSERRKWKHCFDNVRAIIFLVAVSEYDQLLKEDEQRNRLKESFQVFVEISEDFKHIPVILFLNKTDILCEKIKYSHLDEYFPEFKGPRCDIDAAKKFFSDMFQKVRPKMYYHYTCATDTENIQVVFTAVKDIILNLSLERVGLV